MPIDLRNHTPADKITIRPDTHKAAIIKLLYENTNLGYTPAEIRRHLDLPRGSSSTTLTRLHDEGRIGKTPDGLYHGLDHRADLRRFAQSLVSLDSLFQRYSDVGLSPDDIEQTGETAKEPIPPERLDTPDEPTEEPSIGEWIVDETDSE